LDRSTKLLSRGILVMSLLVGESLFGQTAQHVEKKCHWWQFRCDEGQVEGLPAEAPRDGTVITIDVATNRLYLFRDGRLVDKSLAATGSEKVLRRGHRIWLFRTPQGHLKVLRKIADPIWTKPDWAFVEAGEPVPPLDSPKRKVKGHLGKYALDLGDGIMIHGTDQFDSIGRKVSPRLHPPAERHAGIALQKRPDRERTSTSSKARFRKRPRNANGTAIWIFRLPGCGRRSLAERRVVR